jgi:hypothetical protein
MMKTSVARYSKPRIPGNPCRSKAGSRERCVIATTFILLSISWLQPLRGIEINPVTPAPGTSGLSAPPEMKAWVTGLGNQAATVKLYRRVAPPATRPDFTLVVLPDTQFYTGSYLGGTPEIFNRQTEWIASNAGPMNIACVLHMGDIVLRGGSVESEWIAADTAMSKIENPVITGRQYGVPYAMCVGDHDGAGDFVNFNRYFGARRFSGRSYYGGNLENNNKNHYITFSASGLNFVVVSIEEDGGRLPAVMSWASSVLRTFPNHRAIVISHQMLYPGGEWTYDGKLIYDALKDNPNLFMMHCGHDPEWGIRWDHHQGRSVVTLLSDYSSNPNGGDGYLRTLRFSPAQNLVEQKTYSPWNNKFKTLPGHSYSFNYDMSIPEPSYSLVSTRTAVSDGIVKFGIYPDIEESTTYDWYVTAEVQGVVTKSAIWSFSTASDYSLINYPAVAASPSFSDPIILEGVFQTASGYPAVIWKSKGGRRYRVEYRNESGSSSFIPIVRSVSLETDPAPAGTDSYQVFVDDGTLTGGVSTARQYQVREMAPVKPLEIIRVSKPLNGNPAIMWHSVGGRRYRVEYSNGSGSGLEFREVVRSQAAETDPAPEGSASFQTFVDDGTLTGGASSSRFYRVREVP